MNKDSIKAEGLLPSLFWRIDEAEQTTKLLSVNLNHYKADVLRNLRWIMNSSQRAESDEIYSFPEASDSVLNYGIPVTTGKIGTTIDVEIFIDKLSKAILRFETRIIPETLEVSTIEGMELNGDTGEVGFVIAGDIWCEPLPERFSVETFIDSDTGDWIFK